MTIAARNPNPSPIHAPTELARSSNGTRPRAFPETQPLGAAAIADEVAHEKGRPVGKASALAPLCLRRGLRHKPLSLPDHCFDRFRRERTAMDIHIAHGGEFGSNRRRDFRSPVLGFAGAAAWRRQRPPGSSSRSAIFLQIWNPSGTPMSPDEGTGFPKHLILLVTPTQFERVTPRCRLLENQRDFCKPGDFRPLKFNGLDPHLQTGMVVCEVLPKEFAPRSTGVEDAALSDRLKRAALGAAGFPQHPSTSWSTR